ncbi:macrophage mannose receptor 1 isoform X2 [Bacillus rossius redtenbacheri]|uniref:macrophage mannose receptor 1 isoform X2 n=1 Tax=Bacillus rossius redtenbacheri TaxID=93214 RepID=UPI002FDE1C94
MLGHGVLLLGALVCASGYIIGSFTHLQLEMSNENSLLRSITQDLWYIRESVMKDKEDRVYHPQHDELDSIKGYRMFDGHYYKLVKSPGRNWAEARESCQEDGGDLAVIDSQEEADFLLQLFSKDPSRWDQYVYEAFVGVTDQASEGNFLTVNGRTLNSTGFDHWLPNEPNNGDGVRSSEEDCVTFHKGRAYNDVDCDREMPYFCEVAERNLRKDYIRESVMKDKEDRVHHPQHDELDSIKGYRMFDGHYYKLVKSPGRNWAEARESCQEDGGDLAVIDSQEEADFLLQLFSKDPSRWDQYVYEAFVGVTDQASEGNFLTVNGRTLNSTGFDHWLPNEPNNGDGVRSSEEDCVTFHKGRAYNDVDCDREMPYFCEVAERNLRKDKLDKHNSGESAQTDKEVREHHEPLEDLNTIGGYRMFDGHYYKLVKSPGRNWAEARESCQEEGGDLAVIDSQEEADFLLQLFSKDPSRWDQYVYEAFVGVTDQASEGNFLTFNGSSLNSTGFDDWMPNEPNNGDGVRSLEEDCVTYHKGRAYNDVDCDREMPYFCEKVDKLNSGESAEMDKEVREHQPQLEELNTIEGYRMFDGHYYKLVKSPGRNWIDARESCQEDGGDLAVIDSQEEADFLLQLFSKDPSRWDRYVYEAFVGVTDQASEGNFLTINGSTLNSTGFDHWLPNEPNNGDGVRSSEEDCVTFHKGRAYNDVDCDREIPYFCEVAERNLRRDEIK